MTIWGHDSRGDGGRLQQDPFRLKTPSLDTPLRGYSGRGKSRNSASTLPSILSSDRASGRLPNPHPE